MQSVFITAFVAPAGLPFSASRSFTSVKRPSTAAGTPRSLRRINMVAPAQAAIDCAAQKKENSNLITLRSKAQGELNSATSADDAAKTAQKGLTEVLDAAKAAVKVATGKAAEAAGTATEAKSAAIEAAATAAEAATASGVAGDALVTATAEVVSATAAAETAAAAPTAAIAFAVAQLELDPIADAAEVSAGVAEGIAAAALTTAEGVEAAATTAA